MIEVELTEILKSGLVVMYNVWVTLVPVFDIA